MAAVRAHGNTIFLHTEEMVLQVETEKIKTLRAGNN
jgi:hypothetical protein